MSRRIHPAYRFDLDPAAYTLPDGFLFGVANSPYHSEGGFNVDGGPHNNWATWEATGRIERSGDTNRMWADPGPHLEASRAMGLNAFRMGFEWARVQPSRVPGRGPAPDFDPQAFDRYAEIVGAVRDAGMEPVITLHHFTHPAWAGDDVWTDPDLLEHLQTYIATVVTEVNERLVSAGHPPIQWYVTFNEPFNAVAGGTLGGDHPPGHTNDWTRFGVSLANIMAAHVAAYDRIHDIHARRGWGTPSVGFNYVTYCLYEIDKIWPDAVRARERGVARSDVDAYLDDRRSAFYEAYEPIARHRLNPLQYASWRVFRARAARVWADIDLSAFWDALYASPRRRHLDYLALDCYDPFSLGTLVLTNPLRPHTPEEPRNRLPWWQWTFDPLVFREHLRIHAADSGDLPVVVLETNIAHRQPKFGPAEPRPDRLSRSQFLKESLQEVMRLGTQGSRIDGYVYWTLCDNFEWGSTTVRLGLLEYDFAAHAIRDTDGLGDPTAFTFATLIAALRSGDPVRVRQAFAA